MFTVETNETNVTVHAPRHDQPRGADQFVRDSRTEALLADQNLPVDFRVVDIADIDLSVLDGGEPERQMRRQVVDAPTATRYADDLAWGARFPAGILAEKGAGLVVIDFHHRLAAARVARLTQVSAYVVPELSDFDAIELGALANRTHGLPLTEAERIDQAVWGLDLGRFKTVRQAARTLGVKEAAVAKTKRVREAKAMATSAGVPIGAFERLPTSTQDRLGTIGSPEVFKAAADAVIRKGLGTNQVSELVVKINEAGGDDAKLGVIKAFAADIEPKKTNVVNLTDGWVRVHAACRNLLAVDLGPDFDLSLARRTAADLSKLFGEVQEVTTKLQVVATKLDEADGVDAHDLGQQADAV